MRKITKAVITAAGLGTRFLPATKNVAKELIPIINKPTIQYKVEACIAAGITDIIIVTRFGNHSVEDFFDSTPALESYLKEKGKDKEAEMIKNIYTSANFTFVRQDMTLPYGQGAPLYSVRRLIHDEPFFFGYGDDFVLTEDNYVKDMVDMYNNNKAEVVLSCIDVDKERIKKLSVVNVNNEKDNKVVSFIEKPKDSEINSTLSSIGSYILPSDIFEHLDPNKLDARGEFIFQQSFDYYIPRGTMYAYKVDGKFLTNGDPLNFLISNVEVGLSREDVKEEFRKYLLGRLNE
ncbi:MAG: sugar phosphate nucleotidyltransferase [bacterium]